MATAWIMERSTKSILKLAMEGQPGFKTEYNFEIGHGNMRVYDFGRTFVFQDKVINLEILGEKIILRKGVEERSTTMGQSARGNNANFSKGSSGFVPHWNQGMKCFILWKWKNQGSLLCFLKCKK